MIYRGKPPLAEFRHLCAVLGYTLWMVDGVPIPEQNPHCLHSTVLVQNPFDIMDC